MYTITSNFADVITKLSQKVVELGNPAFIPRAAALAVLPKMRYRVFVEGKTAAGTQIGTYANSYLAYRAARGRGTDPKVILSLTRQMENDLSVVAEGNATTIGFKNPENAEKLVHLEEKYQQHILSALSEDEVQLVIDVANDEINKLLK
jgi:hypothetical protein